MSWEVRQGDALNVLRTMPDSSVQMCVTSPPYYGLRNYGVDGQIGLEASVEVYVQKLVEVFRKVQRVLYPSGTLWLNLGDSYWGGKGQSGSGNPEEQAERATSGFSLNRAHHQVAGDGKMRPQDGKHPTLKPKDLIGVPWRVAFALQQDGWWLRSDIIWAKKNCMPESVQDRPTRSHEYLFLLAKSQSYYYDADAIKEQASSFESDPRPSALVRAREYGYDTKEQKTPRKQSKLTGGAYAPPGQSPHSNARPDKQRGHSRRHAGFNDRWDAMKKSEQCAGFRNKRDVWWLATEQYKDAHFAVFPEELVEPCIRAGSKEGDVVLDPFCGSGTTGVVALKLGRSFLGIDLNPDYVKMAQTRIGNVMPLFSLGNPATP